jgi:galactose mutarotase-like enzyme
VGPDGAFVLDYSLRNTGPEAEPFLWCLHPLLTIKPGDRLELPAEVRSLRLNGGLGVPIKQGDTWDYPEPFPGVRLDQCLVPGMPGGCVKAFAGPLGSGRAAVVNDGAGDRLELRWDAALVPFLGLWINRGHCGFHHVALEPATGAPDSLADAVGGWRQFSVVQPGRTAQWSITLDIS